MTTLAPARRADHYDDPAFNYQEYWRGRDYEHLAEQAAIDRLLAGRRFRRALDVGGGYGRLSVHLARYADEVILAEPSEQQLGLARAYLRDEPRVRPMPAPASDLALPAPRWTRDAGAGAAPPPRPGARARRDRPRAAPGGTLLLEFANLSHALNRVRYLARGRRVPRAPVAVARATAAARRDPLREPPSQGPAGDSRPGRLRAGSGAERLEPAQPGRQAMLNTSAMLRLERRLQPALAPLYFGPSIWLRLRKTDV